MTFILSVGCEKRCHCENEEVTCVDACYKVQFRVHSSFLELDLANTFSLILCQLESLTIKVDFMYRQEFNPKYTDLILAHRNKFAIDGQSYC